jgi:hypothetical protein
MVGVFDKEIIDGLNNMCSSVHCTDGTICQDCFVRIAQQRLEVYSNFIENLLQYEDELVFSEIKDEAKFLLNKE